MYNPEYEFYRRSEDVKDRVLKVMKDVTYANREQTERAIKEAMEMVLPDPTAYETTMLIQMKKDILAHVEQTQRRARAGAQEHATFIEHTAGESEEE